ncbi:CoA transferase [Hypericibacter adhaerens]|jgi:crotonobetainyl-CoA:carnitine CoA-transferase CaiB-like acyl-CoA transferase|uniref:CoA transferase n=1 Tax=Hypericibacter adhaerens TaxID=2602016 RepID=A0A5J6N5H9_9PROT|nr:CoA transferase [Hypericibacter adhaerens]QEX24657.1 CoA transferase [Hypericibacter adhaerens]
MTSKIDKTGDIGDLPLSDETSSATAARAPLHGIRVIEVATFIAAPFCGTILGDFGAEIIKIEQPTQGDPLRAFGTRTECGDSLVWLSESRNKKAVTLDLRQPKGAELFRRLVAGADVVIENFRPGTMEKWGLGFEDLRKVNDRLVMLSVSAYGQTGPKRQEPGFARIAHAFGGLAYLAGESNGRPVVPGSTSMADYLSGMWGAIGVLLALRARDTIGKAQLIDIGLYESVFRLLDEIAPAYAKYGFVRERQGADTVNVVPHSHYQTGTGEWVAIACTSDKMFARIAAAMGRPELATSPDFATSIERVKRRDEVNRMVAEWVGSQTLAQILAECEAGGVPCAKIYSIKDIFEDPQYKARENLMKIEDPRLGPLVLPTAMPRMSETPAQFQHAGRALGADTAEVFGQLLGIDREELETLRKQGIV